MVPLELASLRAVTGFNTFAESLFLLASQLCPLLWLLLLLLFCYWISNWRIRETSGNWISDKSLKLSDYQILDSQKSSCPPLLKLTTNRILLVQSIQQYDTPTKGVPGTESISMLHGEILLYLQPALSEQLVIKGVHSLGATSGKIFLSQHV